MRNALSVEMVDNADEARSYTETLVLDPLNPQQSSIAIGYFHDPDEDILSVISRESIPEYRNVEIPVPPATIVEDTRQLTNWVFFLSIIREQRI